MSTFTKSDLQQLKIKGITSEQVEKQLQSFANGFPPLDIAKAATIGDGIMKVEGHDIDPYIKTWEEYQNLNKQIVKFVPASGAATRMFSELYSFLNGKEHVPTQPHVVQFFQHIQDFAFYEHLNAICFQHTGSFIPELIKQQQCKPIINLLLNAEGMNYGNLPKALLLFHHYSAETRTPLQEHLVESAYYAANSGHEVQLHFTISSAHENLFKNHLEGHIKYYEELMNVKYKISFSQQKSLTDTIAADMNNEPFRDETGLLVFRPGGHGALIENLNAIDADIIFIKNIDNVTTDKLRKPTITYKRLLGGILVETKRQIFTYLNELDHPHGLTLEKLEAMKQFCKLQLNVQHPILQQDNTPELIKFLHNTFNRPIRVCGMVANEGEPGGGPYFAKEHDGSVSLQILESSQIDTSKPEQAALLQQATHFNPVDLVCAVRNYKGKKFDLRTFIDPKTGFIAQKTKNGKVLKALELPGLWNGAMSNWNTIFVDVPLATFSPVKTANDLLRPEHR
ncbi:DUF4301 family protein [Microbacter margulisiae]|uniref:DUF4301 domain-containing protein n=1 Tax=Microbacter margulisiae TaxID=1350067 RepID=A0A7W5DQJ5_9PORP|nr:DUF4301 family protein [Microbacter margulisiae]MBB3187242.1 hypothetical protein [Microbacter margulisiae]